MYLRWKAAVDRSMGWVNTPEEKGVSRPPSGILHTQHAPVVAGRSQLVTGVAVGAAAGLCVAYLAIRLRSRASG